MEHPNRCICDGPTPEVLRLIANARRLTHAYAQTDYTETELRTRILQDLLGRIGENVMIETPFHCDYGKLIFIGNDVIINMNCTFVDNEPITIGNRVLIAPNVQLYTASHPVHPAERIIPDYKTRGTAWFRTYHEPITIQDGVWIGGGAIVLPGVTIGENSVIGAGSVVTHNIPANCLAVGNPCRPIHFFTPSNTHSLGSLQKTPPPNS